MTVLPLQFKNVCYKAPSKATDEAMPLIKDMSFTLEPTKRTVIIGPNGAGKSLLLRLCHGLIQPSDGEIVWAKANAAQHQAMVFQRPVMLRRTAAANIQYALTLNKVPKADQADIIDDVLTKTGLRRHAQTQARVMSFGEQQRLAIARAWALKPEVLFLDEPTASLDPSATHQIEELVNAMHQQGTKIIMTSHDLGQAKRLGDEILFLHRGRLLEHAPAEQFFNLPQNDLAQAFIKGDLLWWKRGEGARKNPKHSR
ncbi:MAG: ABC transporter ATP-binding protein [Rhodospirillaceae bacterium]|nr:MAG: ABC transporter ATP-binding protein [Rhodospirillaceae bacterium]